MYFRMYRMRDIKVFSFREKETHDNKIERKQYREKLQTFMEGLLYRLNHSKERIDSEFEFHVSRNVLFEICKYSRFVATT